MLTSTIPDEFNEWNEANVSARQKEFAKMLKLYGKFNFDEELHLFSIDFYLIRRNDNVLSSVLGMSRPSPSFR